MIPRYTHNCDKCRYLGRCDYLDPWSKQWIAADLYFCESSSQPRRGSCIARVGHAPYEYASAPLHIAERYEPPFSTLGRAIYVAALDVICSLRITAAPEGAKEVVP